MSLFSVGGKFTIATPNDLSDIEVRTRNGHIGYAVQKPSNENATSSILHLTEDRYSIWSSHLSSSPLLLIPRFSTLDNRVKSWRSYNRKFINMW